MAEEKGVIDLLSPLLEGSVQRIRLLRDRHGYAPSAGSPLGRELRRFEEGEISEPEAMALMYHWITAAQLAAAEDNILALRIILRDGNLSISPVVLARAAIEAAARAAFLLDPELSANERASYVTAEKLYELGQMRRVIIAHDPRNESRKVQSALREVDRSILDLQNWLDHHHVQRLSRPRFTGVIERVFRELADDGTYAAIATNNFSAVAHAIPEMVLDYIADATRDEWHPFSSETRQSVDEKIVDVVMAVLVVYTRAVNLQINTYGWPHASWSAWFREVIGLLRSQVNVIKQPRTSHSRAKPDAGNDTA